ncbi:molybdate ABC transporter substrate-binding protein [Sphingomonadales bacterium 56]|uniref:molybdate ABC transporter substrate-binding protein n=1 Tax=unclassified Sphingobium TaxID=2611147 RepID=UPI00191B1C91|nr:MULTISPECIES: molybdate ABC transporter substrate-binding protein [unclassified Sphingobium]MBY2929742.1 molybdate ABC transporter substrate-binding protein [Sphingomonadales bacterium 56]MBY2960075.1 molybdate ABC transporter substrate-binding protein [Sphingomonadales bacterium 58]CAD7340084.1 Molybdate-binding protein ModA [Sphingobium sp. S6]CAD7340340.1 Molybdate-binding protein ModA [Sphingobium sp. S8]
MRRLLFLLLILSVFAGRSAEARERGPLVLAAASLQESLTAAADAWTAQGYERPILSFAASSALARQIEAGAPADLFLSADEPWMDAVAKKGLLRRGTRATLLTNKLVLIAPAGTMKAMQIRRGFPLARALGNGRLAMADPGSVPAGKYGKASLTALGVWPAIAAKIAAAENVRAALAMVERRQVPLGIVYATDARASKAVRIVGVFPEASHPPITYPLALLSRSTHREAAGFHRFLLSARAKAIFRRYGFGTR